MAAGQRLIATAQVPILLIHLRSTAGQTRFRTAVPTQRMLQVLSPARRCFPWHAGHRSSAPTVLRARSLARWHRPGYPCASYFQSSAPPQRADSLSSLPIWPCPPMTKPYITHPDKHRIGSMASPGLSNWPMLPRRLSAIVRTDASSGQARAKWPAT
jgi:hypothetical protein